MKTNVNKILKRIEESKIIISRERDKLRDIHSELTDLLESFDEGIEQIEYGRYEIEKGIDALSQYV